MLSEELRYCLYMIAAFSAGSDWSHSVTTSVVS
jgi:hypothetical protein